MMAASVFSNEGLISHVNSALYMPSLLLALLLLTFAWLAIKRKNTKLQLSSGRCDLPTVCWMPKFVNYLPEKDVHADSLDSPDTGLPKKLPSSNITNVLPRMERLNGPYGMYATVYGVSTKVVHVAHPIPAKAILMGKSGVSPNSGSSGMNRSSIATSLGAVKSPGYDHFKNFSGDGVFTADGKAWKTKRASVLHCLLKGCTKDGSEESLRLEREANIAADSFISNAIASSKGGDNETNIVPWLQRATIGLIYRFITHDDVETNHESSYSLSPSSYSFEQNSCDVTDGTHCSDDSASDTSNSSLSSASTQSISSDSKEPLSPPSDVQSSKPISKENNPFEALSSYLEAITNIRMIILAQSRSVWFLLPRWFYKTFSSMYQEEERQMVEIRKFAVAACENAQLGSPLQMLRSRKSHNPTMDNDVKNGHAVNKELLDEAITLLFAGQDTSAATLSWTLHLLSLYPNVQRRLAQEVRSQVTSLENSQKKEIITKRMISKMPYLDAVIKEAMRLYPVAPFVVRRLTDDLSIASDSPSGGMITLPKDTFACVWIYSLHRNKKLWNRPDDFVPERWIDPDTQRLDDAQTKHKGTFMPFAAGPRNCVGQPLAHTMLRIILAKIMNQCEVADKRMKKNDGFLSEEEMLSHSLRFRKDMQAGFTVLPSGGVKLIVKEKAKKIS